MSDDLRLDEPGELAAHLADSGDVAVGVDRREELAYFLRETVRHLSKQDTLESAGFFDYFREEGDSAGDWNNDTVVYALQVVIADWLRERWGMDFEGYVRLGEGFCPPEVGILRELGMAPAAQEGGQA